MGSIIALDIPNTRMFRLIRVCLSCHVLCDQISDFSLYTYARFGMRIYTHMCIYTIMDLRALNQVDTIETFVCLNSTGMTAEHDTL